MSRHSTARLAQVSATTMGRARRKRSTRGPTTGATTAKGTMVRTR